MACLSFSAGVYGDYPRYLFFNKDHEEAVLFKLLLDLFSGKLWTQAAWVDEDSRSN